MNAWGICKERLMDMRSIYTFYKGYLGYLSRYQIFIEKYFFSNSLCKEKFSLHLRQKPVDWNKRSVYVEYFLMYTLSQKDHISSPKLNFHWKLLKEAQKLECGNPCETFIAWSVTRMWGLDLCSQMRSTRLEGVHQVPIKDSILMYNPNFAVFQRWDQSYHDMISPFC